MPMPSEKPRDIMLPRMATVCSAMRPSRPTVDTAIAIMSSMSVKPPIARAPHHLFTRRGIPVIA